MSPEQTREELQQRACQLEKRWSFNPPAPDVTERRRVLMNSMLKQLGGESARIHFLHYIWGVQTSKDLSPYEIAATLDWLELTKGEDGRYYPSDKTPHADYAEIVRRHLIDMGQLELGL